MPDALGGAPAPWRVSPQLRELRFEHHTVNKLELLQGLPDKLTLLEFCWQGDETLSSTAAPDLAHMTALQHLRLIGSGAGMRMCPSLLLQMRQLRHLQLSQLVVDMPALLAALRGLQQLQHLDVSLANGTWALEGAAMQQYSAFTALCQLTHLRVAVEPPGPGVEFDTGTPLPVGAVQYIFPAGKQLPRLKQLHLGVSDDKYIGARFGSRWKEESRYMELLGPGDLAVVAAACPALEQFWAIAAVVSNAQLADVARMTSVTQLKIGGHGLGAAALVAAVPQMPQLQDLSVVGVRDLEPKDLPPLTQLTALRQLRLSDCPGLEEMEENGELLFTSKEPPPDVWQQLRQLCCTEEHAAAAMLQLLEAQHARDRARGLEEKQSLQAQLAGAQGMVGSLQQQLAEARSREASLQEQLAAAHTQIVQLGHSSRQPRLMQH